MVIKTIKEEINITKKSDKTYVWTNEYVSEMDEESYNKNLETLKNRVKLLKTELKNINNKKDINKRLEELETEKLIREEALNNFEEHWKKIQEQEIKRMEEEQEYTKKFLEHYEELKKIETDKIINLNKQKKEALNFQLLDTKKLLKTYENVKE
jgi:hypothetical protein